MTEQPTHIGRYEIVERVGRGGMGVLYRGRDTVLEREVAIKVMSGGFASDEAARHRFFREAKAAARLQHRNVVTVFEFAEHHETPYIVMEFLRGRSLAVRMTEKPDLTVSQKLDVVIQLCAGLEFAHRAGLVHRDVKPANVWLCEDGSVKLLDFGIAKSSAATLTNVGSVMGSPSYMSPEQISGKDLDGRSDVFSTGVLLYQLLGGRKPFQADSPTAVMLKITGGLPQPLQEIVPKLPSGLFAAVARALEKDPDARYARAADLAGDLRLLKLSIDDGGGDLGEGELADQTLAADQMTSSTSAPTRTVPMVQPVPKRARVPVGAVAAAAGVVILLAGIAAYTAMNKSQLDSLPARDLEANAAGATPLPASAPAVATVRVRVTSDPDGAALTIDGKETGTLTPFEWTPEYPGRTLRLVKRGFQPADLVVTPDEQRSGAASVTLRPLAAGKVQLSGPYPFEVLEGNRVISRESDSHQILLTGPHTLVVRARDVLLNRSIAVSPKEGGAPFVWRAPALGLLVLRFSPAFDTCTVALDDVSLGSPPITEAQRVVEGKHTVSVKCPSGQDRKVPVVVVAGESREARIQ